MQHPSIEKAFIDADYCLQTEQYQAAAVAANKVLEVNPKDADALYMLGVALTHLGLTAAAAGAFQQCVAAKPEFWQAWNNLGNCFQEQHPKQAKAFYKKASDIEPDAW